MYRGLWNCIRKIVGKESSVGIFLAVCILCWTVSVVVLGLAGTALLQKSIYDTLAGVICTGAYAGIIFGLVGGILYLRRSGEGRM